jgi:hypothetical protein
LSRYTAIEVIVVDEVAVAVTWIGEPTVAPGVGDETVTPANAAEASASRTDAILRAFLKTKPPEGGSANVARLTFPPKTHQPP